MLIGAPPLLTCQDYVHYLAFATKSRRSTLLTIFDADKYCKRAEKFLQADNLKLS